MSGCRLPGIISNVTQPTPGHVRVFCVLLQGKFLDVQAVNTSRFHRYCKWPSVDAPPFSPPKSAREHLFTQLSPPRGPRGTPCRLPSGSGPHPLPPPARAESHSAPHAARCAVAGGAGGGVGRHREAARQGPRCAAVCLPPAAPHPGPRWAPGTAGFSYPRPPTPVIALASDPLGTQPHPRMTGRAQPGVWGTARGLPLWPWTSCSPFWLISRHETRSWS